MLKLSKSNLFILLLALLLVLSPIVSAQDPLEEARLIQEKLNEEFGHIFFADNPQDLMVAIVSDQISGIERIAADFMKKQVERPELLSLIIKPESEEALIEAQETKKTIFLIGGPSQNDVTKKLIQIGLVEEPKLDNSKIFSVARGKNRQNADIVVLSDLRGYNNLGREGARLSPLAKFMPVAYVPATASLIGILLAYLLDLLRIHFGKYLTGFGKKSARVKEKYMGFRIAHIHIKFREYLGILFGASVFGLAIAISYTGLQSTIIQTFQLTLIVCLIIFAARELIRLLISWILKIHAEFVFWFSGAIISLVSGFLGNTMNTVAFIFEFQDKDYSFEKSSKIKYSVVLVTFIVGSIFFVLNFLYPSKLYQMTMASATTLAMAEIIPVKPLQGVDIKKWKPRLWRKTFSTMAVLYVLMNFII